MNLTFGNNFWKKVSFFLRSFYRRIGKNKSIKIFGHSRNEISAVYVINLDRQVKRWANIRKELQLQRVSNKRTLQDFACRISAIDGRASDFHKSHSNLVKDTYDLKDQYFVDPDPQLLSIIRNRSVSVDLTREEIAVALSHINVWERIIEEDRSFALILEDDIFFEKGFAETINHIWEEIPTYLGNSNFDLLYLSYREVDRGAEKVHISKNLSRPIRGLWWLSGYVLSKQGARKLVNELPIAGPVDLWMNHKFKILEVLSSNNSIIYQRSDILSDNNYSILPILSQIGIQSDKTHLFLEQKKGRNPAFVIDFNGEAHQAIGNALLNLGYRCCTNRWDEFSGRIDKLIKLDEPLLFDAYSGFNSICTHYKTLDSLYPSAVFILLVNNDISSKLNTDNVVEYFSKRRDKLIILNILHTNSWERLCKFLDCSIPDLPFPNTDNCLWRATKLNLNHALNRPLELRKTKKLEHDVHPWIIPVENLFQYGVIGQNNNSARLIGTYNAILIDNFSTFNDANWTQLESSFPSNLALFTKKNFSLKDNHGFSITVKKELLSTKCYSSASIASKQTFQYGRFEIQMKPLKVNGVISAFFLHRNDPWQEIDLEFLGNDTTKVLLNVYYNPGVSGSNYNYGNRGTPSIIDLNFDASSDFHDYAIEWEPHEIRWYVDNILVHIRATWAPTPIPEHHMQLYINTWPSRAEELVGCITENDLPGCSYVNWIKIYSWSNN